MILDNENQRKLLMQILESITLQGNRVQMNESLTEMNTLVSAVYTAKITVVKLPSTKVQKNGPA